MYEAMFYHLIKLKTVCANTKVLNPIPNTYYFTTNSIENTNPKPMSHPYEIKS